MSRCPDCKSENTGDLDCPMCWGGGVLIDDDDQECDCCDGLGYVRGHRECLDCGSEYAE